MKLANRCPRCGGIANHYIMDVFSRNYYRCMTGLTSFMNREGELSRSSNILACETIIDSTGKVFTGMIAYREGERDRTLGVTEGKERR